MSRARFAVSADPRLSTRVGPPSRVLAALGAAVLAAGAFAAPERVWPAVLVAGLFIAGLGLAGLFYVALHYTTGARWDVALRRVAEALAALAPAGSLLALVAVVAGGTALYPWLGHGPGAGHAFGPFKALWLTPAFFFGRSVLYAGVWTGFALALRRISRLQDAEGDPAGRLRRRATVVSAAFLPVFAITVTLASVDWGMALEPHWYSTIYGVYHFAGLFVAGLAALILLALRLRSTGPLAGVVSAEHLHDLGKLLFAMATFWAYIWFSQYMLIWYGNLAEEAGYFTLRSEGAWAPLFWANPIVNWVVPFLVLLPARAKRSPKLLAQVSGLVLAGHALDLYLAVYPPLHSAGPVFGGWEAGIALGAGGLLALLLRRTLAGAPAVPLRDPFLAESLHHHG